MKHKTITLKQLLAERPCQPNYRTYSDEPSARLKRLWGTRKRASLLTILNAEKVPSTDRLWVAFRRYWWTDEEYQQIKGCLAAHVLPIFEARTPKDDRPRKAALVALDGRSDVAAAYAAAYAASAAAYAAAYAASAAASDASAAASDASAASDAYDASAAADAADSGRTWQLDLVRRIVKGETPWVEMKKELEGRKP